MFIIKKNGDEMNIHFISLILIQLCALFKQCANCLFEIQRLFLKKTQFQTSYLFAEFAESYFHS